MSGIDNASVIDPRVSVWQHIKNAIGGTEADYTENLHWGLSNAAATLVGQNLGAGNPDRAELRVER